jgi:hypothetical protein
MNLLAPDYLDRDLPLSKADRKEVRRQAWGLWFRDRRNLSIYILAILAYNLAANGVWMGFKHLVPQPPLWQQIVATAVFLIGLYALILMLQRWRFVPLVRRVVREQGFRLCEHCHAWLQDATACSRCGRPAREV